MAKNEFVKSILNEVYEYWKNLGTPGVSVSCINTENGIEDYQSALNRLAAAYGGKIPNEVGVILSKIPREKLNTEVDRLIANHRVPYGYEEVKK